MKKKKKLIEYPIETEKHLRIFAAEENMSLSKFITYLLNIYVEENKEK